MVAGCVEDVVPDESELQLVAKQRLPGSKVEIDVGRLTPLREVLRPYEVSVELKGGVLCQTEVVDAASRARRAVRTGTALVGGTVVVERERAAQGDLPPLGGLADGLQLQSLAPFAAGIDDAVERHTCIVGPTDVIDHARSPSCKGRCRQLRRSQRLTP